MALVYDGTLGLTYPDNSVQNTAASGFGFKNRIINGAMVIDQRNAGASVTPTSDSIYTIDRWKIRNGGGAGRFSVVQSSTSAANFSTSVLLTVTTTAAPSGTEFYGLAQDVEGYNIADFGWGTANAQSVTVSFQVRSSLTGTYCLSIRNSAADRSYVAEFTINAANTFETKTITIPAITTGTWLSTNGAGLLFVVCLGSGSTRKGTAGSWQSSNIVATSNQVDWINTSGATFYITGVQLEKGSTATSFDYRPYGTELSLCQRYFQKISASSGGGYQMYATGSYESASTLWVGVPLKVTMRAQPTFASSGAVGTSYGTAGTLVTDTNQTGPDIGVFGWSSGSGGLAGQSTYIRSSNNIAGFISFIAEL